MPPKTGKASPKKGGKKGKKKGASGDDAEAAFQDYLNEMFFVGPQSRETQKAHLKTKIREVFEVLQGMKEGHCDILELGTLVRGMGLNPTVAQLKILQQQVEDPETTNFLVYEKLEPLLLTILMSKELKHTVTGPDGLPTTVTTMMYQEPEDQIQRAFLAIWEQTGRKTDQDRSKYVGAEPMREMMTRVSGGPAAGEQFDENEIGEFLQVAAEPETGLIKEELFGIVFTEPLH